MTATDRQRARRAEYLAETGRSEPPDRRLFEIGRCAECGDPFLRRASRQKYCVMHSSLLPKPGRADQREAHRISMLARRRSGSTSDAARRWWACLTPDERRAENARRFGREAKVASAC